MALVKIEIKCHENEYRSHLKAKEFSMVQDKQKMTNILEDSEQK